MVPLLILTALASIVYAVYRGVKKWGICVLAFLAAAAGFLGASGVLAEKLWGPQWSWNFAHHGPGYVLTALTQGVFWLMLGLRWRASRQL